MKKYLVILVALMVVSALILSACSTSSTPSTTAPATTAKPTTSAPTTSAAPTSAAPTSSAPTSPSAAVKTIKFSYTMPKGAAIGRGFDWFGPAFEKATNGRYKVEIYPGSSLIPIPAAFDSVKSGAVEMAYTSTGTFPKQFPLTQVTQLPSLGMPEDTPKMWHAGTNAFWEFFNTTPEIKNEFKDVTLLLPLELDPYKLVSKKTPIKSAADFKGLKVGGTGPKMFIVTANGGASVQQIPPDSYLNMDKGVTDAAFITWSQVYDYKISEIANYYLEQEFGSGLGIIIMNSAFFNAMGAADQKILMDTWTQALDVSAQGAIDDNVSGVKAITAAGKSITVPTADQVTAWDKAAQPAIQSWRNDAKSMGATDAALDPIFKKWSDLVTKYLALGK
jgi:C4-dicarboxylate-binding protein DctP